ncbi:MAG: RagB/SusD family nutrient uptake outer membrane protein, partial [Bacteroidales bacterium]|nr:RagB/SusD family nutrient uptake outer membrane protein [Bacteroidales bacterium]
MRIKNILFVLLVWAAAAGVVSCDKFEPLLDIKQDGAISFSNMWQDANDVVTSTNGIYYRLRSCFVQDECNVFYWGEARVGEYMWGPGLDAKATDANKRAVLLSNMTGATGSCSWSALYTAIDQANSVIKYAPQVDMDQAQRDYCLGQAYFARAYCYFWAARLWGDVPLNLLPVEGTNQPETYPERAPKAEVYERIGLDIEEAQARASLLGSDAYFATAAAVNLLDAEYSLWMYSTQNGGDAFLDRAGSALGAMGLNRSRLSDNYSDVFDRTKKKGKEVIFALRNDQTEKLTGGYYFYFYHPTSAIDGKYVNNPVPAYKTQWWSYSQNFVDILQASRKDHGDKRVSTNLGIGSYGSGDGRTLSWPNKFLGE